MKAFRLADSHRRNSVGDMVSRSLLLAPLVVPQALWVAATATRLPEAAGPRSGRTGKGAPASLLLIGDSAVAGVGAKHQDEALTGQLVTRLSRHHQLRWKLIARTGATAASTLETLEGVKPEPCDLVLIGLGVNDAKNGVSQSNWERRYARLLDEVTQKFGPRRICVSGVPPLRDFPLLPWPLNEIIGSRAERFDAALQRICAARNGVTHLPLHFDLDVSAMAQDGFHPGPEIYRLWAERAATILANPRRTCGANVVTT
jgi:lysophospholipase L1-like esterase